MASLDAKISDIDIAEIAKNIVDWKDLSPYLGLNAAEQKVVEKGGSNYLQQACGALRKWQQKNGDDATYRAFIAVATKAGDKKLADYVKSLVGEIIDDGGESGATTGRGSSKLAMTCYTDWMTLIEKKDYSRAAELWVEFKHDLWPRGQELKVKFPDEEVPPTWKNDRGRFIKEKDILHIANEWHRCGVEAGQDVVPKFVECGFGEIPHIEVEYADGVSESLVGTAAIKRSPSMRLDLSPQFNYYKRTIRHEFGHALGLQHEHQHPNGPDHYDEGKLREYLISRGVHEDDVDGVIFYQWKAVKSGEVKEGDYDPDSVMHYCIPEEARLENYKGPTKTQINLSDGDKKYIVEIYLKHAQPPKSGRKEDKSDTAPKAQTGIIIADSAATEPGVCGEVKELTADDMIFVVPYLTGLSKQQINTLGKLLGLSVETVNNCPDPTLDGYLTYILDQWAQKPDKVKEVGIPSWNVLESVLRHKLLRQTGKADTIRKEKLS